MHLGWTDVGFALSYFSWFVYVFVESFLFEVVHGGCMACALLDSGASVFHPVCLLNPVAAQVTHFVYNGLGLRFSNDMFMHAMHAMHAIHT